LFSGYRHVNLALGARRISMRSRIPVLVTALVLTAMLVAPAAHAVQYSLDTAHSEVLFKVKHMTISTVTGSFKDFEGGFDYDPATGKLSGVKTTIKTASITTNNDRRDQHLRSDDFLNAEAFPAITFVSKEAVTAKTGKFQLKGDLTIRDVTKPVVLDGEFVGAIKDPWGNNRAAFSATTTINRQDYGVKWSKSMDSGGLVASDDVVIQIAVEAVEEKPEAEKAAASESKK
jgi:polyisoprenoid-binding protein YceI